MQTVHTHITAGHRLFDLKFGELRRYRGLIWLFTKRSFVVTYKQTVLGPLWVLLTPLLTSFIHMVVFGGIAKLSTDGVPQLLFYLTGNALWGFFAACVASGCATFTTNASLFSKVYFPRLVMPLSDILGNALRFAIQLIPVVILLGFYAVKGAVTPHFSCVIVVPFVLLQLAALGMGFGLIISSLTTKYRDLRVLVSFGIQLWMYATPVVYPLSTVSGALKTVLMLNPVTSSAELVRLSLLGAGTVTFPDVIYSSAVAVVTAICGIVVFNKVERTFADTI